MKRIITDELVRLARETVEHDGETMTRAETLSRTLWKLARGYEIDDPNRPGRKLTFKPSDWAAKLLAERIEGKAPSASTEDAPGSVGWNPTEAVVDMAAQRDKANAILARIGVDDGDESA